MASVDVLAPMATSTMAFSPAQSSVTTMTKKRPAGESVIDVDNVVLASERVQFDPQEHLQYTPPAKIHAMKDLDLPEDRGISPVAVSEPFPLFSPEAVQIMRSEVLSKEVWDNCHCSSDLAPSQLRGFASEYAPFCYDAWRSPETLAIISKIAGVDLVPQMDLEIAHVNVSMQSEQQKHEALAAVAEARSREFDEGVSGCPWEDDHPIVDWHTDSYPFVCVTMLSDCTNMVGGETALRKGNGDIVKVRGPQMGCAVVLQGRYIEHQAVRALGTTERISMVTSFRPKSAVLKDDTVLTTVRPISDLSELYFQYSEYRLEMLEERIRAQLKDMRDRKRAHRRFNTKGIKAFISEQVGFLDTMDREMVDESKVAKGITDDSHLLSEDLKHKSRKKARTESPEDELM